MRKHSGTIALVSLAIVACSGDNATGVTPDARAMTRTGAAARGTEARHVTGSCETTPIAPPIVTFPILRQEDTGVCQLSHLGRTELHTSRVVNLVTGTQVAEIIYTAANGDELRATAFGKSDPPGPTSFRFTGTTTIVSGTGRFASATGELQAQGVVSLATANASIAYDGWITYAASDRSDR